MDRFSVGVGGAISGLGGATSGIDGAISGIGDRKGARVSSLMAAKTSLAVGGPFDPLRPAPTMRPRSDYPVAS